MHPLIITVAGIGAELTKKDTPYLPLTPDEIAEEAKKVFDLGATVFHLHARDSKGRPTLHSSVLRPLIRKIRNETDLVIQISTGGAVSDSFAQRLKTLDYGADMGSLTLGSINFGNEIFSNPTPLILRLAEKMKKKKIKPELEIFDAAMAETAVNLCEKGVLTKPLHFNIILGGPGWLAGTRENLKFILKKLPPKSTWSASGVGKAQLPMIEYAITHGGHVRTGLEDNIYIRKGVLARGNAELVEQVVELAKKAGRDIATIQDARKILGV